MFFAHMGCNFLLNNWSCLYMYTLLYEHFAKMSIAVVSPENALKREENDPMSKIATYLSPSWMQVAIHVTRMNSQEVWTCVLLRIAAFRSSLVHFATFANFNRRGEIARKPVSTSFSCLYTNLTVVCHYNIVASNY